MTPAAPHPTFLVAANRPALGRTLLAALLADWLSTRHSQPCALADGDPLRGALARLTGQAPAALSADSTIPENAVVDNADALAPAPAAEGSGGGDVRSLASLGRWLTARAASAGGRIPALACILLDDRHDGDRLAADALRQTLTDARACAGMIAVRNLGLPDRFPTHEDQEYARQGGWPTSKARAAWLNAGGRELVLNRPFGMLWAQAKALALPISPGLASHPSLWTFSRQQAIRLRRDFADRAERACTGFLAGSRERATA